MHFPIVSKKTPTVSKQTKAVSKKAPIVSKIAKIVNCKHVKSSTVSRKLPTVGKKAASKIVNALMQRSYPQKGLDAQFASDFKSNQEVLNGVGADGVGSHFCINCSVL